MNLFFNYEMVLFFLFTKQIIRLIDHFTRECAKLRTHFSKNLKLFLCINKNTFKNIYFQKFLIAIFWITGIFIGMYFYLLLLRIKLGMIKNQIYSNDFTFPLIKKQLIYKDFEFRWNNSITSLLIKSNKYNIFI